jgi:hypothetical protein
MLLSMPCLNQFPHSARLWSNWRCLNAPAERLEHIGTCNGRAIVELCGNNLNTARQAVWPKHHRSNSRGQAGARCETRPKHQIVIGPLRAIDRNASRVQIGKVVMRKGADRRRRAKYNVDLVEKSRPFFAHVPTARQKVGEIGGGKIEPAQLQRAMGKIADQEFVFGCGQTPPYRLRQAAPTSA